MGGTWLTPASDKYGGSLARVQPATRDDTATATVAPAVQPKVAGFMSPGEPLFWFGVIAAAGVGLMAYATVVPASS